MSIPVAVGLELTYRVRSLFHVLFRLLSIEQIYVTDAQEALPTFCTVYNHMVKAGGSSIKQQLMAASRISGGRKPGGDLPRDFTSHYFHAAPLVSRPRAVMLHNSCCRTLAFVLHFYPQQVLVQKYHHPRFVQYCKFILSSCAVDGVPYAPHVKCFAIKEVAPM